MLTRLLKCERFSDNGQRGRWQPGEWTRNLSRSGRNAGSGPAIPPHRLGRRIESSLQPSEPRSRLYPCYPHDLGPVWQPLWEVVEEVERLAPAQSLGRFRRDQWQIQYGTFLSSSHHLWNQSQPPHDTNFRNFANSGSTQNTRL